MEESVTSIFRIILICLSVIFSGRLLCYCAGLGSVSLEESRVCQRLNFECVKNTTPQSWFRVHNKVRVPSANSHHCHLSLGITERVLPKFVFTFQFWLKSNISNGHFMWRPACRCNLSREYLGYLHCYGVPCLPQVTCWIPSHPQDVIVPFEKVKFWQTCFNCYTVHAFPNLFFCIFFSVLYAGLNH